MSFTHAVASFLVIVTMWSPALAAADDPPAKRYPVELKFVGEEKEEPLAGVQILVTQGYGSDRKEIGPFTLDKSGVATVELPLGFYHLHLTSKKSWPYLPVERLWAKRERGITPMMSVYVTADGIAKWLDGRPQPQDLTASATPGGPPRLIYRLLPACELTLRVVDVETGEGVPGVTFFTENAVGEDWAHFIDSENLGAKPTTGTEAEQTRANLTGEDGYFRRLVGANAGYTYGVGIVPPAYVAVTPGAEVTIDVVYGQAKAEHVFKLRRK